MGDKYPKAVIRVNEGPLVLDEGRLVNFFVDADVPDPPKFSLGGDNLGFKSYTLDPRFDWTLVKNSHGFVVLVPMYMKPAQFDPVPKGLHVGGEPENKPERPIRPAGYKDEKFA